MEEQKTFEDIIREIADFGNREANSDFEISVHGSRLAVESLSLWYGEDIFAWFFGVFNLWSTGKPPIVYSLLLFTIFKRKTIKDHSVEFDISE